MAAKKVTGYKFGTVEITLRLHNVTIENVDSQRDAETTAIGECQSHGEMVDWDCRDVEEITADDDEHDDPESALRADGIMSVSASFSWETHAATQRKTDSASFVGMVHGVCRDYSGVIIKKKLLYGSYGWATRTGARRSAVEAQQRLTKEHTVPYMMTDEFKCEWVEAES